MRTSDVSPPRDIEAQAKIIDAARRCFKRDGVRKTRIAAVAAEAGMVRQTVYSFVESRAHLLELAMTARMAELAAGPIKVGFRSQGTVADDLVEVLAVMTETMNADDECGELADGMTPQNAMRFMTGPDSGAQSVVVEILAPFHRRAQKAGIAAPGLDIEDMAAWARNALAPLAQRDDLGRDELRQLIRRFVLPAFLRS